MFDTTLTTDQRWALARLRRLLERRCEVDRTLGPQRADEVWLIRALDAAIVSYYQLADELGLREEADTLLRHYREAAASGRPCPGALRASEARDVRRAIA
jgi:hypothetical protein